jgi:hypothetical protein
MNITETLQAATVEASVPVIDRRLHNEANFQPQDYTVMDYLDNHPPEWEQFCPPPMFGAEPNV